MTGANATALSVIGHLKSFWASHVPLDHSGRDDTLAAWVTEQRAAAASARQQFKERESFFDHFDAAPQEQRSKVRKSTEELPAEEPRKSRKISWDLANDPMDMIGLLKAFYDKNGEPPRLYGRREHEQLLMRFIQLRILDKENGWNQHLCDRVEREIPWWSWTGR